MKILILPSKYITNYSNRNFRITLTYIKNILTKFKLNFEDAKQFYYLMEHYHYAHFPHILGKENTFIIGEYYQDYLTKSIPPYTRYPSLHNSPEATHISFKDAINSITDYDAVIIGIRSGEYGESLRKIAKKKDILVAYLDYSDHPQIYRTKTSNQKNIIFRGLKKHNDFDIFFKHDVPISFDDNDVHPICPMPLSIENYPDLEIKNFENRNINISFLGRLHDKLQKERGVMVNFLQKNFNKTYFKRYGFNDINRQSLIDYSKVLQNSKIIFSPSGKVWDSVRHAEAACYKSVPLISKPYCKLANNLNINKSNSIFYDLRLKKNDFEIININQLEEKINHILNNENIFNELSNNWYKEIKNKNTLLKRAEYLINIIRNKL